MLGVRWVKIKLTSANRQTCQRKDSASSTMGQNATVNNNDVKKWENIAENRRSLTAIDLKSASLTRIVCNCNSFKGRYQTIVRQLRNSMQNKPNLTWSRKIWCDMFGSNSSMDKDGFRKWIKAIGIFPDLADDAPIDHLFRSYDRNR